VLCARYVFFTKDPVRLLVRSLFQYNFFSVFIVVRAMSSMPDGKTLSRCQTARSKTFSDPVAGPASIKLGNFGLTSLYVRCILRRRLDEQLDEKEVGKESGIQVRFSAFV